MDIPSTSGFKRPNPLNNNNNNNNKSNAVIDSDNEMEDELRPSNTSGLDDLEDNDSGEDNESQSDETTFVVTHELHEGLVHSIS
jgi:hypothetical protein